MSAARYAVLGLMATAFAGSAAMVPAQTWAQTPAAAGAAKAGPNTASILSGAIAPAKRPAMSEGVAAQVNNEIITTYDLRQRVLMMLVINGIQPTEENLRQVEREALRSLVDEHLQMQEVRSVEAKNKDAHVEPTQKELDDDLDGLASQYGVKRPQLVATLKSAGVEVKTLTDQLTAQMSWRNYIGGRYHGTIHVGDDQVNQEQARLNASAAKAQYQVSEILVDPTRAGSPEQALEGAKQLAQQIKQGAPFSSVARQFSALPTAANGGDSGWLNAGDLKPQLESALETMRPGQVSDPIVTSEGVYLVQLRDKHAGVGATLVSLKQAAIRVPEQASAEQLSAATAKLDKLRDEVHACDQLETAASKFDGVVAGDLGETDVNDLAPEFKQVVDGLKVGQIGGPVRTKAGLHLVALCGRRASGPHSATREEIADRLQNEQLSNIARRYLRDLHNSATIESR